MVYVYHQSYAGNTGLTLLPLQTCSDMHTFELELRVSADSKSI